MRQYSQDVIDAQRGTFGRHLVSLTWFEQPCNGGQPIGDWTHYSLSGCIMSFDDQCALLTAGHILEGLDNRVRDGQAQVWGTGLFHGMGYKPATEVPMEFPYLTEKHWHEQSMAKGIDIGAVHIAPAFRSQCEANGVVCLSAEDILNFPPPEFQEYVAMGVPLFTYSQKEHELDGDIGHEGRSQLVGMPVRLAEAPTEILPTEYPRVFFRPKQELSYDQVNGMSGAPIFGLCIGQGRTRYRLAAMQYGYRGDGIVVASPAEVFVPIVRDWLDTI